ncbi:MAG: hypothetical protein J7M26_03825 [Armatimonadetes bacterium]|nr:hypothetical protein [Armatimonadota bacterium]
MRPVVYAVFLSLLATVACQKAGARLWLESSKTSKPSAGQLLKNPSLDATAEGKFSGWSYWDKGYVVDQKVSHSGGASARCTVTEKGPQHGIAQTVVLNQKQPIPILARAWSKAQDVSGSPDNNYSLYLDLEYMDGTPLWGQVTPFATGTHDWQQVSVLVVPAKPVKSVNVYGIFRGHTGTVWFDDFELYQMSGAGQFDMVPAIGSIPQAKLRWQKLDLGSGQALLVDANTGAMSLDGQRLGGLILRDVAADSAFHLPELKVTRQGGKVLLSGKSDELKLEVKATLAPVSGGKAVRLDCQVRDLTGKDRAITVYWALPVPAQEWTWCQSPRRSYPAVDSPTCGNFGRCRAGANSLYSRYPFAPIVSGDLGLSVGAPITVPRLARFAFDSNRRVLYAAFDLGLSPVTKNFPSSASFSALLYTFDPAWRFRSALKQYYQLNASAFVRRVKKQGIWMPFMDIATVQGWEDFCFQFQEGAPNPTFDEEHGIYSFPYIEPMSYWMAMPKDMPRDDAHAMQLLHELASKGNRRAIATLSSGIYGVSGKLQYHFQDAPWCNGAMFLLNPDPNLPGTKDAPVTQYQVHQQTINRIFSNKVGASGWAGYGAGYSLAPGEGRGGSQAIKCQRSPGASPMGATYPLVLNQDKPRPFIATAWSKAEGVTGKPDRDYSVYIDISYRGGGHLWGQKAFFNTGSHGWQKVEVRVEPEKPVASASVHLLFRGDHYGTVWFDDVSVKDESSGRELVKGGDFEAPPRAVKIDGLYLDSFEMGATVNNYRREHFASADLPLVFDRSGRLCELGHFMVMELTMHVAELMHKNDRLMFANGVLHNWPWPAGYLDVFGTETNWHRDQWRPPSDEAMLYWRALCYQRPYLTLQNTNFDAFPHSMVEKYFARCCYYGVLPSFFSPNASTGVYWSRPELYNRDRDLFRKYHPVILRIAEAGWQPITYARTNQPEDLWVERFGEGKDVYFTIFNNGKKTAAATVTVDLKSLGGGTFAVEQLLPKRASVGTAKGSQWAWRGTLEPEEVAVLHLTRR